MFGTATQIIHRGTAQQVLRNAKVVWVLTTKYLLLWKLN